MSVFYDIDLVENKLLSREHSSVELWENLRLLNTLRKDLYEQLLQKTESNEQVKSRLTEEYNNFCNFIYNLLINRKMSNANFIAVVSSFLKNYLFIEPIDNEAKAYNSTLKVLIDLKEFLKISNGSMRNYRLKEINKLLKQFEANNKTEDQCGK